MFNLLMIWFYSMYSFFSVHNLLFLKLCLVILLFLTYYLTPQGLQNPDMNHEVTMNFCSAAVTSICAAVYWLCGSNKTQQQQQQKKPVQCRRVISYQNLFHKNTWVVNVPEKLIQLTAPTSKTVWNKHEAVKNKKKRQTQKEKGRRKLHVHLISLMHLLKNRI